jgi:hypothetical protein
LGTISGFGRLRVYRNLKKMNLWVLNIGFLGIEFRLIEILRLEVGLIVGWARLGFGGWQEEVVRFGLGVGVKFGERALWGV